MSEKDPHDEWVWTVLEIDPQGGGSGDALEAALDAWQTASEAVDKQISALRSLLMAQDDPDLKAIADKGLNAITGRRKVGVTAALLDVRRSPDPAARAKAAKAAKDYRSFIESDPRVEACDSCPAPAVTIRETLSPALSRLETALAA